MKWKNLLDSLLESFHKKNQQEDSTEFPLLEEKQLDKLQKVVQSRNIPLSQALEEAINLYYQHQQATEVKPKISEERKERNPLLRLEGLCARGGQR